MTHAEERTNYMSWRWDDLWDALHFRDSATFYQHKSLQGSL